MSDSPGKELPRAMPITMTFYDMLKTHPYTCTFYVPDNTTDEECEKLIRAVEALSMCVLGKYKIGHKQFIVPGYQDKSISNNALGTRKSRISYYTPNGAVRSHTIPGCNAEHAIRGEKTPNPNHPAWQAFLAVFRDLCVSKEGEPIEGPIDLSRSDSNWPPKSAKKRKKRRV
ncbi:MAG: hypothetical protein JXJ20_01605 [Anaerolineae bacterium]|nr:hypothetical protein [Anaerolineae bacterium]